MAKMVDTVRRFVFLMGTICSSLGIHQDRVDM